MIVSNRTTTTDNDHDGIIIKMIVMGIREKNTKVCNTRIPNTGHEYHGKSRVSASSSMLKLCNIYVF